MLETELPGSRRITLGADKGYDTREFVAACRALKVTPHIARNESRAGGSALEAGLQAEKDSMAERDGFEPSRPFISALQRAPERAEPKAARLIERLWAAACAILKSGASQFRISRIDPLPPRTLDLWISGTLAGHDVLPIQGWRITIEPGEHTDSATDHSMVGLGVRP
jgi:hypothetical protein